MLTGSGAGTGAGAGAGAGAGEGAGAGFGDTCSAVPVAGLVLLLFFTVDATGLLLCVLAFC